MSAEALRERIREIPDFPKPGILFYDITTLLKDPAAYRSDRPHARAVPGEQIDLVRDGVARVHLQRPHGRSLGAGLVPVRKLGKLPAETITVEYALEYGSTPSRSTGTIAAGPEGPHRRRPARDRRHGQGDRARRAAEG